jgi:hypothetical protein
MLNEELIGIVDTALRIVTLGRNSIDNIYDPPLPSILDPIFTYIEYVAPYDQQQVVDNLLLAADKYGHGKVIDAETFEAGYVANLAEMTSYLKAHSGSSINMACIINEKKQHEDLFFGERMWYLLAAELCK